MALFKKLFFRKDYIKEISYPSYEKQKILSFEETTQIFLDNIKKEKGKIISVNYGEIGVIFNDFEMNGRKDLKTDIKKYCFIHYQCYKKIE